MLISQSNSIFSVSFKCISPIYKNVYLNEFKYLDFKTL